MKKKFILFFLLSAWSLLSSAAQLTMVHIKSDTIEFQLTEPLKPRVFSLNNPNRIVVDFEKTRLAFNLKNVRFKNKNILAIREGYPKPQVLRMVMDTKGDLVYKIVSPKNSRWVILEVAAKQAPKQTSKKTVTVNKSVAVNKPTVKASLQSSFKPLLIVIDPGHGGKDPGAIGEQGTKEKEVVLAIAKNLANMINRTPGMRAVLTRDGDYYVSLRERLLFARKHKADLFIAIHADSYFDVTARGASVYSLSRRGASTVAARWLAQRENHEELGGVDFSELEDQSYVLRSVLIDLAQTSTTKESLNWGASLLDALDDVTTLHYSRVEQAPFMVLKSPDIPSLLVETGFISNGKEEKRLRDKAHQNKIAAALFKGIRSYQAKLS